jgi:hypothetical protein
MSRAIHIIACGAILALNSLSVSAQDVESLLPFIPEDANSIAVIRARELKESPRGRSENWAEQHETNFLAGASTVPPWVQVLVRASYMQPGAGSQWTAVLVPVPRNYSMNDLATREESPAQAIGTHPVVYSPRYRGYFVQLAQATNDRMGVLGGIAPASRQDAARWIDEAVEAAGETKISEYLVAAATSEAHVVLALDTRHMLDPAMIAHRLNGCVALEGHDAEKEALANAFSNLHGVTLSIDVENAVHMALKFDFDVDLGEEAQYVKPVFVELLNDLGAALDELETAEPYIYQRSVSMESPLSDESLRRILSLITTPRPSSAEETMMADTETPADTDPPTDTTPPAEATDDTVDPRISRRYWDNVNRNIDDLLRAYQRATNYERTAQWHENFANRIDQLSTRRVDPDLVKYAGWISSALRSLGTSLRGTAVDVGALEQTIVYNWQAYPVYSGAELWWGVPQTIYGPYTYGRQYNVQVQSNLQQVREQQAAAVQATAPEREQIWKMINAERSETQKAMVERYGTQFE